MELALNKVPMEGYVCPLETTVYQEETQEAIVPDACPDILTILATEGRAQLIRKECGEGKAEATGSVRAAVLYLPDGGEGPRKLELDIPFRVSVPAAGLTQSSSLVVVPRVTSADTRALNPRKVLCRVELAVFCQGWSQAEETLCTCWGEETPALQQRTQEVETYLAVGVFEKPFAFTDEVNLTGSHPAAGELLGHRLDLHCGEAKIIGNKLIFKGEATLQVRYRTAENSLATGRWDLPFSQIMEVGALEEEGSCALDLVERESEVTLADSEDGRTFAVHLELMAQAVIRQNRTVTLFTDAYSVKEQVTVERQSYRLTQLWEENSVTQVSREILETNGVARGVEDCFLALGQPRMTAEDTGGTLAAQGQVTVLYTAEDGTLCAAVREITVSTKVALPVGGICRAKCALAGDIQAVATGMGIEVRCPVQFAYLTTLEKEWQGVAAIQVEEMEDGEERPSVILRLAQPGETLWDIAKAYSTTQQDILATNELPDPDHLAGVMLLIPRSR